MSSLNKVTLIGRLGTKPELKFKKGNEPISVISLATEDFPGKNEEHGKTQWHRVVFFGRQAELLAKYAEKGSQLYLEARLSYSTYKGADGKDVYKTDIVGSIFIFLSNAKKDEHKNDRGA